MAETPKASDLYSLKPGNIAVYSTVWCPDCKRAKKFFGEQRVQYMNVDLEEHPDGVAFVEEINNGSGVIPTIIFPDGAVLAKPSNAQLAGKLGLQTQAELEYYDVIIGIVVEHKSTGEKKTWNYDGVFVFIGVMPNNSMLKNRAGLDSGGFLKTEFMMTSSPGIFAASDVRSDSTKQAASASREGASAALAIRVYLKAIGG